MGEFSEEILRLMPEVAAEHAAEQARNQAEQEAYVKATEERRLAELAADERYRQLGREAVGLLQAHQVPTVPIYIARNSGYINHVGNGWPVFTIGAYQGADYPSRTVLFALQDTGLLMDFRQTSHETRTPAKGRGNFHTKKYEGILFPSKPFSGQIGLMNMEKDVFKRGIASLIATGEPYHDPTVYQYDRY